MKKCWIAVVFYSVFCALNLSAHCQMPCGIYHDDMVYDQIDQYVETMYKGCYVLSENKKESAADRNQFSRWVYAKEKQSDEIAQLILTYFLQQKIKPGEADTAKRIESAHKLLFLIVQIKQNCSTKLVNQFADEWDKFKLMFHVEGYECQIEQLKKRKREILEGKIKPEEPTVDHDDHDHEHEHDHDHDHAH